MSLPGSRVLRSLLERWSRGRKFIRRLPNGLQIYVSPDSQLKYLNSSFDSDLISLAEKYASEETSIWDIGANCGVLAFSASRAKQVIAVEADPFLCDILRDSVDLNGAAVSVVCAAASSERGIASFSIASRGRASNHLTAVHGRSQTGGERGRLYVCTITLDELLAEFGAPSFVKIDVEGAEIDVLLGARRLLSEVRPIIYIETVTETHPECERLLRAAGYKMFELTGSNWLCEFTELP